MLTNIIIEGYGSYVIDSDKINELLIWINKNKATYQRLEPSAPRVEVVVDDRSDGKMLINESNRKIIDG